MADFWDKEEFISSIKKNTKEEIQIKKVSKGSKEYIDIRIFWYDAKDDSFKPSSKGVTIPTDAFEEFKEIINKI